MFIHISFSDGDEEDGMDETLCPVDYASSGMIVDDEVHAVLVKVRTCFDFDSLVLLH